MVLYILTFTFLDSRECIQDEPKKIYFIFHIHHTSARHQYISMHHNDVHLSLQDMFKAYKETEK
jgi:hypothetical protein